MGLHTIFPAARRSHRNLLQRCQPPPRVATAQLLLQHAPTPARQIPALPPAQRRPPSTACHHCDRLCHQQQPDGYNFTLSNGRTACVPLNSRCEQDAPAVKSRRCLGSRLQPLCTSAPKCTSFSTVHRHTCRAHGRATLGTVTRVCVVLFCIFTLYSLLHRHTHTPRPTLTQQPTRRSRAGRAPHPPTQRW